MKNLNFENQVNKFILKKNNVTNISFGVHLAYHIKELMGWNKISIIFWPSPIPTNYNFLDSSQLQIPTIQSKWCEAKINK
jgi:hypothetical protein